MSSPGISYQRELVAVGECHFRHSSKRMRTAPPFFAQRTRREGSELLSLDLGIQAAKQSDGSDF